jgi:hypothetical protein
MPPFWFFLLFIIGIFGFAFLKDRQKHIKQGTWLGVSGVKTQTMWSTADAEHRKLLLAAIGVLDGEYRDSLLPKKWSELPSLIQISLTDAIKEIDAGK